MQSLKIISNFRIIENNRTRLLKELFLLTKDNQDIMHFLNQAMEGEILTPEEITRQQTYLENHEFR